MTFLGLSVGFTVNGDESWAALLFSPSEVELREALLRLAFCIIRRWRQRFARVILSSN